MALEQWTESVDEEKRTIRLELGVFSDPAEADAVAQSFAVIGAVDEESVRVPGADATRLVLTHLKPGVVRADVMARAEELGLNALVLY